MGGGRAMLIPLPEATRNLSREATEGGYERRKTLHIPSEDDSQQKIMVFQAVK